MLMRANRKRGGEGGELQVRVRALLKCRPRYVVGQSRVLLGRYLSSSVCRVANGEMILCRDAQVSLSVPISDHESPTTTYWMVVIRRSHEKNRYTIRCLD